MYTDENIDEVLGKDEDFETVVDDDLGETREIKEVQNNFAKTEESQRGPEIVELQLKKSETFLEKSQSIVPNYENIIINNQVRFVLSGMCPILTALLYYFVFVDEHACRWHSTVRLPSGITESDRTSKGETASASPGHQRRRGTRTATKTFA